MTRGQITIEKSASYFVYDPCAEQLHGIAAITTQSVYAALMRTRRGISRWRMREEIIGLGYDVLSIDPEMRITADAWANHFDAVTNGGFFAIKGVYGRSPHQFMTSVGVNAHADPDEARAAIAGMLALGPVSHQESLIIVICDENESAPWDQNGTPCLWAYYEEPDEDEYVDGNNVILDHLSQAEAIENFPISSENLFEKLQIEYRADRQLRVWDYSAELLNRPISDAQLAEFLDWIFEKSGTVDELMELALEQMRTGAGIEDACEQANKQLVR